MSALYRWPVTIILAVIWMPFGLLGLLGDFSRKAADRIVDAIDHVNN